MSGARPDCAGIFAKLATLPGRDPAQAAQAALDRVSVNAMRAAANMQNGRPWIRHPAVRVRLSSQRRPCCDHRGRYGHRGELSRWVRCPSGEA